MIIDSFTGQYRFLSNFDLYRPDEYMLHAGILYPSNEHFYQAMKFTDSKLIKAVAEHPLKGLKRFCRQYPCRKNWGELKYRVMRRGLEYKFSLPRYRKLLLDTGDAELIEGNTWGDTFWGHCNGIGENHLGKMLMQIRLELRKT